MFPWEHAAVAYLLYAGYARWHDGTAPGGWAVLVVLVASQLPDLIDKPLAWQFGLLPSGRSLAHSVFVAVPVVVVVVALGIVVLAGLVWLSDGWPGIRELGCLIRRTVVVIRSWFARNRP